MAPFSFRIALFTMGCLLSGSAVPGLAQQSDFSRLPVNVGVLLQVQGDYSPENSSVNSGFFLANMRLKVTGESPEGVGYFFLTNFIRSATLLDGYLYYRFSNGIRLDAGQFRVPFSGEYLINAGDLDFIDRSAVSNRLSPARQIGVQIGGWMGENQFRYRLGVFNGNGIGNDARNDNDHLMTVARLEWHPVYRKAPFSLTEDCIYAGIQVARSVDRDVNISGGASPARLKSVSGTRLITGLDGRMQLESALFSGEVAVLSVTPESGDPIVLSGYHLTAGYAFSPTQQVVLRRSTLQYDGLTEDLDEWIVGYNWLPTAVIKFQVNYMMPAGASWLSHILRVKCQVLF